MLPPRGGLEDSEGRRLILGDGDVAPPPLFSLFFVEFLFVLPRMTPPHSHLLSRLMIFLSIDHA